MMMGLRLRGRKLNTLIILRLTKQHFFRGCQHPKVIRELTPSWDGHVGSGRK